MKILLSFMLLTFLHLVSVLLLVRKANAQETSDNKDPSYVFFQRSEYPRDCSEVRDQCTSNNSSGVYVIKPDGYPDPFDVYCDFTEESRGWTVIQRRMNGQINFNRKWESYKLGFGFLNKEFWLGNERISFLTNQKNYELLIEMTRSNGSTLNVTYSNFSISDDRYKLTNLGEYSSHGISSLSTRTMTDCKDWYNAGVTDNGVYFIKPTGWLGTPFDVYCNMTDGGGWTVFQRRVDGTDDFYLNWSDYREGFGNLNNEFWMGNEKLYYLTHQGSYSLRVDLVNRDGAPYFAKYTSFRIGSENDKYRLSILGSYSGTAGSDSLRYHLNQPFTTKDQDNDASSNQCAQTYRGAWWYKDCYHSNLNGDYHAGQDSYTSIYWNNLPGPDYNIKFTEMKIRRIN